MLTKAAVVGELALGESLDAFSRRDLIETIARPQCEELADRHPDLQRFGAGINAAAPMHTPVALIAGDEPLVRPEKREAIVAGIERLAQTRLDDRAPPLLGNVAAGAAIADKDAALEDRDTADADETLLAAAAKVHHRVAKSAAFRETGEMPIAFLRFDVLSPMKAASHHLLGRIALAATTDDPDDVDRRIHFPEPIGAGGCEILKAPLTLGEPFARPGDAFRGQQATPQPGHAQHSSERCGRDEDGRVQLPAAPEQRSAPNGRHCRRRQQKW